MIFFYYVHSNGFDNDNGPGYVNDHGHDIATLYAEDDGHDKEHKHYVITRAMMVNTIFLVLSKTIRTMIVIIMMILITNMESR